MIWAGVVEWSVSPRAHVERLGAFCVVHGEGIFPKRNLPPPRGPCFVLPFWLDLSAEVLLSSVCSMISVWFWRCCNVL